MTQKLNIGAHAGAELIRGGGGGVVDKFGRPFSQKVQIASVWTIEHWRQGVLLKRLIESNICPDEFINYMLDAGIGGATAIDPWYVFIYENNASLAAGMTYASHAAYTECTAYTGDRPLWDHAGATAKVITSAASKASFTMSGTKTIYGCGLVGGGTTPQTKADIAGGGTLGPVAAFTGGSISVVATDILKVYMQITGSDV